MLIQRYVLLGVLLAAAGYRTGASKPIESPTASQPPALGPMPSNCPPGPTLKTIYGGVAPGVGAFPVWAVGFSGPHTRLDYGSAVYPHPLIYVPGFGWAHKFLWITRTTYKGRVRIHGAALHGGALLSFDDIDQQTPTHTLTLDARQPYALAGTTTAAQERAWRTWANFPGDLMVPRAGCYYLEAQWPGGHWRITFAAGQ